MSSIKHFFFLITIEKRRGRGYDLKIKSRRSFEAPTRTGRIDLNILLTYKARSIPYSDLGRGKEKQKKRRYRIYSIGSEKTTGGPRNPKRPKNNAYRNVLGECKRPGVVVLLHDQHTMIKH